MSGHRPMADNALDGTGKKEGRKSEHFREEDVVDIGAYIAIIGKNWWKILGQRGQIYSWLISAHHDIE